MTETEILDYYDNNWNDYNKIVDLLHTIIDEHSDTIEKLNTQPDNSGEILQLKEQLQKCQDALDEETHKIK